MPWFIEALLQERVWHWLEADLGMDVEGEVPLGDGRIDLVAKTSGGEVWGVEVKRDEGLGFGSTLFEQLNRYIETGMLDRIFFASHKVDTLQEWFEEKRGPEITVLSQASKALGAGVSQGHYTRDDVISLIEGELTEDLLDWKGPNGTKAYRYIESKLDNPPDSAEPVPLEEGVQLLNRARFPAKLGIIHTPLNLSDGVLRDVEKNVNPEQAYEPRIIREAGKLERTTEPEFARREEPWIRHCLWQKYGGVPEAHIPNVNSSDVPHRPIDLIAFSGSYDPTDAIDSPGNNEVIGFEAKGEGSFGSARLVDQLTEYLQTSTLSRLYLAVPTSLADDAAKVLTGDEQLEPIGLVTVNLDGDLSIERQATMMKPNHDGYLEKYQRRKVAYGDVSIGGGREVQSAFVTDEEAERLKNPDAATYAEKLLTDNSDMAGGDGWIRRSNSGPIRSRETEFEKSKPRAYLLEGRSADPYTSGGDEGIEPDEMKSGYVRLTLYDFEYEDKFALKLHFGRGSWEGGYIWFIRDEVDLLEDVLRSLPYIEGGEVTGQGKVLDLTTYPFDHSENESHRVSGSSGEVERLTLRISSIENGDVVARMNLGEGERAGVSLQVTRAQWLDLIATIDIIRNGSHRELPGQYKSYPRIGPSGENTWDIGTAIEKRINPDPPSEWGD